MSDNDSNQPFDNTQFLLSILNLEDICKVAIVAVYAVAETPKQRDAARMAEAAIQSQQTIINKLVEQQIEYGEMMDELVAKVRLLLPPM